MPKLYDMPDGSMVCDKHASQVVKDNSTYVEGNMDEARATCPRCRPEEKVMTDEYREPAGYAVGENFVCLQHLDDLSPTERMVAKVQYNTHPDGETCIVCDGGHPLPQTATTPEDQAMINRLQEAVTRARGRANSVAEALIGLNVTTSGISEETESTVDDLLTIRVKSLEFAHQVMTTVIPEVTDTTGSRAKELIQAAGEIEAWLTR